MTIRIGVIGAGTIAQRAHIPGLSPAGSHASTLAAGPYQHGGCPNSEVVAIAEIDRSKGERVAKRFEVPIVYDDWRELITNPDIDAVTVATPNYLHAEMAIEAMKKGKHVLVEKPMAISVKEADEMIATAEKSGVVLMVEQTERFAPSHEIAKDLIAGNQIGRVNMVRTRSSHQGPDFWSPGSTWFFKKDEAGFGAMFDLGIHKLDLIRWLVADEVVEVAAFANTHSKKGCEVEDQAVAVLRFAGGALGVLEAAWNTDPSDAFTFIYGSEGNIRLGGDPALSVEFPARQAIGFNFDLPGGAIENSRLAPAIPTRSRLGGPFRHFIDCIMSNSKPLSDGHEGRASLSVILAALRSAAVHQFVKPE